MNYKKIISGVMCLVCTVYSQGFGAIVMPQSIVISAEDTQSFVDCALITDSQDYREYNCGSINIDKPIVEIPNDVESSKSVNQAIDDIYQEIYNDLGNSTDKELNDIEYTWGISAEYQVTYNTNGFLCIYMTFNSAMAGGHGYAYDKSIIVDLNNGGRLVTLDDFGNREDIYNRVYTYVDDPEVTVDSLYETNFYIIEYQADGVIELVFTYPSNYGNYGFDIHQIGLHADMFKECLNDYGLSIIYGQSQANTDVSADVQDGENYTWFKKPFLDSAEGNIETIKVSRPYGLDGYNNNEINLYSVPYVLKKYWIDDGIVCDILDYQGNKITSIGTRFEDSIIIGYDGKILIENALNEYYTIENDTLISLDYDEATEIRGTSPNIVIVWNEDDQSLYEYGGGDGSLSREISIDGGIPVYKYEDGNVSDKVALVFDNVLITDFIYDNHTAYVDGLVGLQDSNGKWGYINNKGETVIPFEYDSVFKYTYEDEYTHYEYEKAYSPSNDYVTVCNDSGYGIFDIEGNEVISVGTFEYASPVYDNKAWVEIDGKYGIIEINETIQPPDITENPDTSNTMDILLIKKYILGISVNQNDITKLDNNNDNTIDILDIIFFKRKLLNIE